MPVFLAVRGKVFDVTPGKNFYGPGGPYENFAGRDASRGLACGSFDEDMLTKDLYGPLDDLGGLGQDEMQALQDWEDRFTGMSFRTLTSFKSPSFKPNVEYVEYLRRILGIFTPQRYIQDLRSRPAVSYTNYEIFTR